MLRAGWFKGANVVGHAVTGQAKLIDRAEPQQSWIGRAMRRVTSRTTFGLQRRMFVSERALLVRMTLDTGSVRANGKPCLLKLKTAMRIVAIAALHGSFEDLVMERLAEIRLYFAVATHAKLRFTDLQHMKRCEAGLLRVGRRDTSDRGGEVFPGRNSVWRMAVSTADVVAPVFAASEVVVLFAAGMTGKTSLRSSFGGSIFE